MYKLFVTTLFKDVSSYEGKTATLATKTISFRTKAQADIAYRLLALNSSRLGTSREVIKLYEA